MRCKGVTSSSFLQLLPIAINRSQSRADRVNRKVRFGLPMPRAPSEARSSIISRTKLWLLRRDDCGPHPQSPTKVLDTIHEKNEHGPGPTPTGQARARNACPFFLDCEKTFLTTNTRKYVQTAVKFALKYAYSVDIRHRSLPFTTSGNLYLGGMSGKSYRGPTALSEVQVGKNCLFSDNRIEFVSEAAGELYLGPPSAASQLK
eukprot:2909968-Rhodomonas_salina.1